MTKAQKKRSTLMTFLIAVPACLAAFAYSVSTHKSQVEANEEYFHTKEIPVVAAPANAPKLTVLFVWEQLYECERSPRGACEYCCN